MTTDATAFVERMRRERIEAGLPAEITDVAVLTTIAALIGGGRNEPA